MPPCLFWKKFKLLKNVMFQTRKSDRIGKKRLTQLKKNNIFHTRACRIHNIIMYM